MKIKEGYILRQVADSYMAVPVGKEAGKLRGVIALNESARRIWKELEQDRTPEEVIGRLMEEYDVSRKEIGVDVMDFIELLREKELLE